MTFQEFLDKLAKTPRRWKLRDGQIRSRGRCLLEVVAGTRSMSLSKAKRRLGLLEATEIMRAADVPSHSKLRARLLKACGI